jgi:hypothetical protein
MLRQGVGEITLEGKGEDDVRVGHNVFDYETVAKVSKIGITTKDEWYKNA